MSTSRSLSFPAPSPKCTEMMTFRVAPEERDLLIRFARDLGVSTSESVRHYMLEAAGIFYSNNHIGDSSNE